MAGKFEIQIERRVAAGIPGGDPAHDLSHIRRVVKSAREIAREEGGNLEIVVPAAWMHDLVVVPKSSPERAKASQRSAEAAEAFLREIGYPSEFLGPIGHAIAAHSFSAGITPRTIEAQVLQDADRLDALGAIGIARCFATGGAIGQALYCEEDPFAEARAPDDRTWSLDHFPQKLLRLADSMRTGTGRRLARERTDFLLLFLEQMRRELPLVRSQAAPPGPTRSVPRPRRRRQGPPARTTAGG